MSEAHGILNVAAYKFVSLRDLAARKLELRERALSCGLRGTVLLAEEGINLFLAGRPDAVRDFMQALQSEDCFRDMKVKYSQTGTVPFQRLAVKVKREIVRMNQPTVRPDRSQRAAAVDACTLARWLDQGHDDAGQSVVSYCTGGIRCEKAALLMQAHGLQRVFQPDGGILRYFESQGSRHWRGSCFVFDERLALNPQLAPVQESMPLESAATWPNALAATSDTPCASMS